MPDENGKPKSSGDNSDELSRLLELELLQKRAEWQQASARHKTLKSISLFFLFLVIVSALVAFYLLFSRVNEQRANRPAATTTSTPGN